MMNDWRPNLAKNLKSWRDAYGWSQDVLAEKAECSKSVIRDLEIQKGSASLDMVAKIARALGVSMETLLKSSETPRDLNTHQIGEIAEGAPFNTLLDIVFKKIQAVPADVIEMAYYFKPSEKAWEAVRGAIDSDIKEQREKIKKNKA
jgi:XRE family transcriptional regulator, regulator of sulfur utilization